MAGWTVVTENTKPAVGAAPSGWTPVQEAPPEEKGTLGKIWDWVNKPIADTLLPKGVTTSDLFKSVAFEKLFGEKYIPGQNDFDTKVQQNFGKNPTKDAIKTFLAGSAKDTASLAASMTTPLSLGTMAAGAAAEVPGAIGTLGKLATGGASAGFATKGASELVQNIGQEQTPERIQQELAAGSQVAGGLAGAGATAKDLFTAPKTAAGLYQSALKPSTALPADVRAARVQTGLQEGIPVSEAGAAKIEALTADLRQRIADELNSKPGATVNRSDVAQRTIDVAKRVSKSVNPEADIAAVLESRNEFLRNQPEQIPAQEAQQTKIATYQGLKKSYGELKSATIESQKALARGIKEELENQFPEIKGLNARESSLIGLDASLERALGRIENWEPFGIGTPIVGGAAKAITGSTAVGAGATVLAGLLRNPVVKSKLAIALARKGVPLNAADARISAYTNALANAVPRADQTSAQEGSQ